MEKCVGITFDEISKECGMCGEDADNLIEKNIAELSGSLFLSKCGKRLFSSHRQSAHLSLEDTTLFAEMALYYIFRDNSFIVSGGTGSKVGGSMKMF